MKKLITILLIGMAPVFTGTIMAEERPQSEGRDSIDNPEIFAWVNGSPLSMNLYRFLMGTREQESSERQAYDDNFDGGMHRQKTAQDLVMTELLAQQATRLGMHETELVKVEMAMAEKTLLAQLYVKKLMDSIEIGEADIRDYYDQQSDQAMYRFMIWQTPDEDRAVQILSSFKAGDDPDVSDQDAIETPWLRGVDIAPEVNDMVRVLSVNEFAETPVFQDDLWKVVQVIDKQVMTKQAYEEERDIIEAELVREQLDKKLEALAEEASIVFNVEHVNPPMK